MMLQQVNINRYLIFNDIHIAGTSIIKAKINGIYREKGGGGAEDIEHFSFFPFGLWGGADIKRVGTVADIMLRSKMDSD